MNKKELTDAHILHTFFECSSKVEPTLRELRAQGYTFGNADVRQRLREAVAEHKDILDQSGSPEPMESLDFGDGNYFLTCAQNNTKVHEGFFAAIKQFCEDQDAELIISKLTYKQAGFQNLTSEAISDLWYDPTVVPYLMNAQARLGDFIFFGNTDTLPTAVNPLSGMESMSGELNCGFPHTKLRMQPVATMENQDAKHMYTTGACTLLNYVQRKAGQKAELHHVFGGLFVRVKNGKASVIPISAKETTGEFSVFGKKYTGKKIIEEPVFAVNFGDVHLEKLDEYYNGRMCEVIERLQPQHVFLHDLLDFEARNHHEVKDKFKRFSKYVEQQDSVEQNVLDVFDWLEHMSDLFPTVQFHVVPSNHNDAFYKWANAEQPANDYPNLKFWHYVNYVMLDAISEGEGDRELMPIMAENLDIQIPANVIFHEREESVRFFDIEYNLHGDMGANGARGTPVGLSKLGFKANTGHTHSAGIYNGVYVAGVAGTMHHGYNRGLSGWSNSFIITYNTGKRTIVTDYSDLQ